MLPLMWEESGTIRVYDQGRSGRLAAKVTSVHGDSPRGSVLVAYVTLKWLLLFATKNLNRCELRNEVQSVGTKSLTVFKETNRWATVTDACKPIRPERRRVWPRLWWDFCHLLSSEFCLNFWSNARVRWIRWKEHLGPPTVMASPDVYILPSSTQLLSEAIPASSLTPICKVLLLWLCQIPLVSSQVHENHSGVMLGHRKHPCLPRHI